MHRHDRDVYASVRRLLEAAGQACLRCRTFPIDTWSERGSGDEYREEAGHPGHRGTDPGTLCPLHLAVWLGGRPRERSLRRPRADPEHPTGQALCLKGKVAPEIVYHPNRLLRPLKRTRPKGDPDPGWDEIGWDEALDDRREPPPHRRRARVRRAVVFTTASPSTSAMSDARRLGHASPCAPMAARTTSSRWSSAAGAATSPPRYTFGTASVPGTFMPDLERAGCILFWGYNPSLARIVHATAAVAALNRGARLVVVDPRRVGLAHKRRPVAPRPARHRHRARARRSPTS